MSGARILEGLIVALIVGVAALVITGIPRQTLRAFVFDCHTIISFTALLQLLLFFRFQHICSEEGKNLEQVGLSISMSWLIILEWLVVLHWDSFCKASLHLAE